MKKSIIAFFGTLLIAFSLVMTPNAATADLIWEYVSHSWTWHPDVKHGRDHGSRGKLFSYKTSTVGEITTRSVAIVREPTFAGFPRVERVLNSDGSTREVRNKDDGIINLTGNGVLFTGPEQTSVVLNEVIWKTSGCCLVPGWDINLGITASRGEDQCIEGVHVQGNAVEVSLEFPGRTDPTVLARFRMLNDSQARVEELNENVTLHHKFRFADGGTVEKGGVINFAPLLSGTSGLPFPSYFWSGLLTIAIRSTPGGMTLMAPSVLVIKGIKGQHAGVTGIVPDSVLGKLGNHAGEEFVYQLGWFGLVPGKFFTDGACQQ